MLFLVVKGFELSHSKLGYCETFSPYWYNANQIQMKLITSFFRCLSQDCCNSFFMFRFFYIFKKHKITTKTQFLVRGRQTIHQHQKHGFEIHICQIYHDF